MSSLWYPPQVLAQLVDDRRREQARLSREVLESAATISEWNRILGEIDPHLSLIRAPERTTHHQLRPGFYHILRTPPAQEGQPMIKVIEGPDGSFREPNSSDIESLRAGDMWNDRAMREKEKRERAAQKAAESLRAQEKHDRLEELMDRYRYHNVPKISVPKAIK